MARLWPLAVLLLVVVISGVAPAGGKDKEDPGIKIESKLTKDDPKDPVRNFASKVHVVKLKAGKSYTIDMVSSMFDSYLRLEDPKGSELAQDDDSGGNLNARIVFNCMRDGDYRVIATCFSDGIGDYVLTVKATKSEAQPDRGIAMMLGKGAPDFAGDFAINGKAGKLSDLKGKAVLVEFGNVRAAASIASLKRLREWNKAHQAAGLQVLGVVYYQHEFGQKLAFDKDAGELKDIAKADNATEQAMLKAFAAHHKIDHMVMTLPKAEALKTFDIYAVNQFPHTVLIDRRGMVRAIRIGMDEQGTAALESEIRKVLAEK